MTAELAIELKNITKTFGSSAANKNINLSLKQGEILALFGKEEEGVKVVDIDLDRTEYVRRGWPFFRDRRIDAYGDILKRYGR